jgi:hypothetical protein
MAFAAPPFSPHPRSAPVPRQSLAENFHQKIGI